MPELPNDQPLPPLRRDLEIIPAEHEGKTLFVLHDPESISPEGAALSPAGLALASLLDGRLTLQTLREALAREAGATADLGAVAALVKDLAEAKLLETPEVAERRLKILEEFRASPVRPAALKGGGYPGQVLELASFLGSFLRDPKGPGKPLADKPGLKPPPVGLVSPHIDYQRGGPAYAWAYQTLSESPPPDLIVAVGVAHASPNSPWVLTRKDYETPYGPMKASAELYDAVKAELWYDPLEDEWAHRREHSLELQALWLKFLWRDQAPPWLPVLTSSFERFSDDRAPSAIETVEGAVQRIGQRLAELGRSKRILVLAGVDLAHVGPRFGDEIQLGPEIEKKIESEDRRSLEHALKLEADPFYLSVVSDGHWRKVCGLSALYTSLRWIKALGGSPGSLLAYGQAPDPAGGLVSFASAVFPQA